MSIAVYQKLAEPKSMSVDNWKHEVLGVWENGICTIPTSNKIRKSSQPHDGGCGLGMEHNDQSYQVSSRGTELHRDGFLQKILPDWRLSPYRIGCGSLD
jgi:hypothetical protein